MIFTSSGAADRAFSSWGSYGSTKAAMNNLALNLSAEEPDVVFVAIRPGTTDTEMQREIREKHSLQGSMDEKDITRFANLSGEKKLFKPEQPGHVIAQLVLDASTELSGKTLE